jgi:type II secretory pathway predicted ATPase ExeA
MIQSFPAKKQIEERAFQIYAERGPQSSDLENWLAAEKELTMILNGRERPPLPLPLGGQQNRLSLPMLLDFFSLREQPFGVTPDPGYLYASRTQSEALASLIFGINDDRGFLALVAEPGMGKTTLLYQLLEELRDSARAVLVFQTQCNPREFLEYILHDLGIDASGMGLVAMHKRLNEILFDELLAGKRCLDRR